MKLRSLIVFELALTGLLIFGGTAMADDFNFTPIDFPGALQTEATGINNSGQVAGWYQDGSEKTHGFLDVNGTFTPIDVPGAILTEAFGINNQGDIVGGYQTEVSLPGVTEFVFHGF